MLSPFDDRAPKRQQRWLTAKTISSSVSVPAFGAAVIKNTQKEGWRILHLVDKVSENEQCGLVISDVAGVGFYDENRGIVTCDFPTWVRYEGALLVGDACGPKKNSFNFSKGGTFLCVGKDQFSVDGANINVCKVMPCSESAVTIVRFRIEPGQKLEPGGPAQAKVLGCVAGYGAHPGDIITVKDIVEGSHGKFRQFNDNSKHIGVAYKGTTESDSSSSASDDCDWTIVMMEEKARWIQIEGRIDSSGNLNKNADQASDHWFGESPDAVSVVDPCGNFSDENYSDDHEERCYIACWDDIDDRYIIVSGKQDGWTLTLENSCAGVSATTYSPVEHIDFAKEDGFVVNHNDNQKKSSVGWYPYPPQHSVMGVVNNEPRFVTAPTIYDGVNIPGFASYNPWLGLHKTFLLGSRATTTDWNMILPAAPPPSEGQHLMAVGVNGRCVQLGWSQPGMSGEFDICSYEVDNECYPLDIPLNVSVNCGVVTAISPIGVVCPPGDASCNKFSGTVFSNC